MSLNYRFLVNEKTNKELEVTSKVSNNSLPDEFSLNGKSFKRLNNQRFVETSSEMLDVWFLRSEHFGTCVEIKRDDLDF